MLSIFYSDFRHHVGLNEVAAWFILMGCVVGLKQEAVTMIETLFRRTSCCDGVTPTECVLRHWQFVHNRSLVAGKTSSATNSQPAAPPCTLPSLINILDQIGRHDLAIRLSTFTPAVAEESSQA